MLPGVAKVIEIYRKVFRLSSLAYQKKVVRRYFFDKASGARANRAGLTEALSHTRAGDILVV
jgi:DNA invertase Pin-like site-specific DNA recombinase